VISYSLERATLTPEALFIPLIEACVRLAVVGGFIVALASAPVMVAFERLHSRHFDQAFRYDFVSLHVGLELLIALIVGGLVRKLDAERREVSARAEEAMLLRDELARRVDLLDAANRCARALGSSLDVHQAFGNFIRELRGLVPFDRVAIVLAEDGLAQVMAAAGLGSDAVFAAGTHAPLQGTLLETMLAHARPIYRPRLEPREYHEEQEFRELGLESRLAAPLLTGAKATGMLSLLRRGEDAFAPEEIELVALLGRLLATAVQNIRAYDSEHRTVLELRRLSTMRADFVSLVSHELRTPLASVIGSARTLQMRWPVLAADQRDSLLALIADETARLANLVGEVLDTSRIDAGSFTYVFAEVDLAGLLRDAAAAAGVGDDADVVVHIPRALPVVRGDAARLKQVVGNLIDNAVKYSPEGEQVEVRAMTVNGRVIVDVTDRGVGIRHADQQLIFEKFGRVAGTSSKPGTGLGLYIARAIAEAHGGRLDVTSAPGSGSTFTLTLPIA
jgi:signal transduction histidine kinase